VAKSKKPVAYEDVKDAFVVYIEGDNGARVPVTFIRSKMPPEVVKKIEQGAYPDVSMGCSVASPPPCPLCKDKKGV